MRHPAEESMRRALFEAVRRHGMLHGGGAIVATRNLGALAEMQQLYCREGRQLRVLTAGNGATQGDVGKFWYVPGYSDENDVVPEK